ncbi:hypothetical protein I215_13522 [Galbibacter marinus]|uniref:Uncharacterized protein n=1 Tax=Galbibacter marinus TaxID=555500 RepID=K2Q001_9FLAO|nr:class III extradiol ring-cleavage dioxygenase [Galbibacter marinus]EKF54196.1 hypothetical protein I215_13522 [Galbibacter marinus]
MSIDYNKEPSYHYDLGRQIKSLRKKGVLVIGSGNRVHNLRMVDWRNINTSGSGYGWANEADQKMKKFILARSQGRIFDLAIPTPEHYLPLLYVLGLKDSDESVSLFNDNTLGGSLSMTSVKIG